MNGRVFKWVALSAAGVVACGIMFTVWRGPAARLTATEAACVGRWWYLDPDNANRLILFEFGDDRRAFEHHYYLSSATPELPRISMAGQWRVELDGQMVVEPSSGLTGIADFAASSIDEAIGTDANSLQPVLRQFYWVEAATPAAIDVRCSQGQISMLPFHDIASARSQVR